MDFIKAKNHDQEGGKAMAELALIRTAQGLVPATEADREAGIKNYSVTDEVALAIDRAVARLSIRDEQMGNFIWLYFGAKWPALRIAKESGIGEAKAREVIKAGVAWVDCALEVLRTAA